MNKLYAGWLLFRHLAVNVLRRAPEMICKCHVITCQAASCQERRLPRLSSPHLVGSFNFCSTRNCTDISPHLAPPHSSATVDKMASRSRSRSPRLPRSPSRGRYRSRSRSVTPRSGAASRSPDRRRRQDSRSISRSPTPPPRRNGRFRSDSRSLSRGRGRDSRDPSEPRVFTGTKVCPLFTTGGREAHWLTSSAADRGRAPIQERP